MDPYVLEQNAKDSRVSDPGFLPKLSRGMRKAGHALAFIPGLGAAFAWMPVAASYVAESFDSLIHGKLTKAFKQSAMGVADTAVTFGGAGLIGDALGGGLINNVKGGLISWAIQPISLIATGKGAGELARTATASVLDAPEDMAKRAAQKAAQREYKKSVNQMNMGMTRGNTAAAVGWAPGMQQQLTNDAGMNNRYFFEQEAQRRGVADTGQAYQNFVKGNADHVSALEAARSRQPEHELT